MRPYQYTQKTITVIATHLPVMARASSEMMRLKRLTMCRSAISMLCTVSPLTGTGNEAKVPDRIGLGSCAPTLRCPPSLPRDTGRHGASQGTPCDGEGWLRKA